MNTIIINHSEIDKFNNDSGIKDLRDLPIPVFHDFLFDRFKLIINFDDVPEDGIEHSEKAIIRLDNKTPLPTEDVGPWVEYPIVEKFWIDGEDVTNDSFFKECEQRGVEYDYDPVQGVYKTAKVGLLVTTDDNGDEEDIGNPIVDAMLVIVYELTHRAKFKKRLTHDIHDIKASSCNIKYDTDMPKKKVFMMSDICNYFYLDYDETHEKREMNCPCWSVRGHWRHLKSGKTIFVKSFLKGKRRKEVKPNDKEYIA